MRNYHSALREEKPGLKACDFRAIGNDSVAFVHDITKGLPERYQSCDILYAEIPWPDGYNILNKRAGVKQNRKYGEFIYAIWSIIENTDTITVIVTGERVAKNFVFSQAINVILNGYGCLALVFNGTLEMKGIAQGMKVEELLEVLAQKYNKIGDFVCGYGNSGRIFLEHRKSFVMSDINPRCIGYISANIQKH